MPETENKQSTSTKPGRRKSGLGKVLGIGVVLVLVAIIGIVVALPAIGSAIAAGQIESAVNPTIKGSVAVERVKLSWLSAQEAGPIRVLDPSGKQVAEVEATISTGLLSLITGGLDLGEIRINGNAHATRASDGTIDLLEAVASTNPASASEGSGSGVGNAQAGEPAALPAGLAAKLIIDALDLTYTDAALAEATDNALSTLAVRSLAGEVNLAVGQPLTGTLSASLLSGQTASSLTEDGPLTINLNIDQWSASDGTLTLGQASGTGSLSAEALDADATASIEVRDGAASLTEPATLSLDLQPWSQRLIAARDAMSNTPGVSFEQMPEARITVSALRLPLPAQGGTLDLAAMTAQASVVLGSITGKADPSALGLEGGGQRDFSTAETRIDVALAGDDSASITARGSASVGNESAGTLSADLGIERLFAADGGPIVRGDASLKGVATAILDTFVAAMLQREGSPLVKLTDDLGPTLDLAVNVTPADAGPQAMAIDASLTSERVRGNANVTIDGAALSSSAQEAVVLTFREPAPLLARLLPEVRVAHADPIKLTVSDLRADLGKLAGEAQDLRTLAAMIVLDAGTIAGDVQDAGGASRAFGAGPIEARVDARTLAEGNAEFRLSASGAYDGNNAGTVEALGTASGLLNASGALKTESLPTINLDAQLRELSSSLLAAFVPLGEMGLDPARDIGPIINGSLTASNVSDDELHADLTVEAQHLAITGPLSITTQRVQTRSPMVLTQKRPATLLTALTQLDPPLTEAAGGAQSLEARVESLVLPLGEGMAPEVQNAALQASFSLQNVQTRDVVVSSIAGTAELEPGKGLTIASELRAQQGQEQFRGTLDASTLGVFAEDGSMLTPLAMKPMAKLELRDAPAALTGLLPTLPAGEGEGAQPLPLGEVAREFMGGAFTIIAEVDARSDAQSFIASIDAPNTKLSARGSLADQMVSTEAVTVNTRVSPRAFALLTNAQPGSPALTAPASVNLKVEPLQIPLTETYGIDAARSTGTLAATGAIEASIGGLEASGVQGPITMRTSALSVRGPLAALLGSGTGTANVEASGNFTAPNNGSGSFSLATAPTLKDGAPDGPFNINAKLSDVPTAFIDAIAQQQGLLLGAVGPSLSLDLNARLDVAGQTPIDTVSLGIASQRINTTRPLSISARGDTLQLTQPAQVRMLIDPAWANEYMLGSKKQTAPGGPAPAADLLMLSAPADITVDLNSLVLPANMTGTEQSPGGPLKQGVFGIDASVDLPQLAMVVGDARTPVSINGGKLALKPTSAQGASLDFDLRVQQWTAAGTQSQAQQPSRVWGSLYGLTTETGAVQPQLLNASGSFELPNVPTALVDAFARNDLPGKVLGQSVTAKGWFRQISAIAGAFKFEASSPNATANVDGFFQNNQMVIAKPADGSAIATISRITPELTADLSNALPMLKAVEKTDEDEPARLIPISDLYIPIDGNMDNLNGMFAMDMGTGRFAIENQIFGFISVPALRQSGTVGRRLETFNATMMQGTIIYEPYTLPVGEFQFITVGAVNLSSRGWENKERDLSTPPGGTVDVITYIPGGALAQEAFGPLGLPASIGPQAMVPFRTKGPLDDTKTKFDLEHFGKKNLTPENILKGIGEAIDDGGSGLGDIIRGIGGGR